MPGKQIITVAAKGYISHSLPMLEIRAGQERSLQFELERGGSLRGRVVMDGDEPLGQAIDVRLALPVSEGRKARDSNGDGLPDRPVRVAWQTYTDTGGVFEFVGLRAGSYAVRAEWNAGVSATAQVEVRSSGTQEVELVLPGRTRLRGRLILPKGATTKGLQLALLNREVQVAAVLQESGDFDVLDVAPGVYDLSLLIPVREHVVDHTDERPALIALGSATLVESKTTEIELDVRERFPGSLTIELALPKGWIPSGEARLNPRNESLSGRIGVSIDEEGRAVFARVPAGDWGLTIQLSGLDSEFKPAQVYRIKSNRGALDRILMEPSRATLQFRLRGRTLPPGTGFNLAALDPDPTDWGMSAGSMKFYKPDTHGRATMGLLPGSYRVVARSPLGKELGTASLEWTRNGPTAEIVDLR